MSIPAKHQPSEEQDRATAWPFVLSSAQAAPLLAARAAGQSTVTTSLDLGLTTSEAALTPERILLPRALWRGWDDVAEVAEHETACFAIRAPGAIERIGRFSEALSRHYSL